MFANLLIANVGKTRNLQLKTVLRYIYVVAKRKLGQQFVVASGSFIAISIQYSLSKKRVKSFPFLRFTSILEQTLQTPKPQTTSRPPKRKLHIKNWKINLAIHILNLVHVCFKRSQLYAHVRPHIHMYNAQLSPYIGVQEGNIEFYWHLFSVIKPKSLKALAGSR